MSGTVVTIRQHADGMYFLYANGSSSAFVCASTKLGAWWKAWRTLRRLTRGLYTAEVR